MPRESTKERKVSQFDAELYFLIARFLASGPCHRAAEALKQELQEHKLLPKRIDWEGREHPRSFENLIETNKHIPADHLKRVCLRLGPLLDKEVPPNVYGVQSLLGAGRQSFLRTKEDVQKVKWTNQTHAVLHHMQPLLPPKKLANIPSLPTIVSGLQMCGVVRHEHAVPDKLYSKFNMYSRILGHLSAVYCVAFDRTGDFIFTGADDSLVKIWSAVSGRLLGTLRGHSAEITDMAVNYENTLIAAGCCDKLIRVWCLKTTAPVAVLHGHTGMVTSLQFCPMPRGDMRYLVSTGADGNVCFWSWNVQTNVFNLKPAKFTERSRAGAQMLCSSFSPGGAFLATGSTDHVVRVYCIAGAAPEKICELESHTDRVDSIQYNNRGDRFVSGSRDGTARIWRFNSQEWKAMVLNMNTKLPGTQTADSGSGEDSKNNKHKVTMVDWNIDDSLVVTAVNDYSLKVWDSHTGKLVNVLLGHEDEVFVLEHNPTDPRIMLSAGHDGNLFVWNLHTGAKLKSFFNLIQGQGHGAVFDCKWSPYGMGFAATDSHGHILQFGHGSSEKHKQCPEEMFFHTDYRPLIRDANSYVLDEQTQQPPHLMPPPFLVDIDGNPHPPSFQRLVPGRQNMSEGQLIPAMGVTPNGDREVLDIQEQAESEEQGDGEVNPLDAAVSRMQRDFTRRMGSESEGTPSRRPSRSQDASSPGRSRGPRRSGQTEGVRQSIGNVPVSQQATQHDLAACSKRVVVRELASPLRRSDETKRLAMADEEIKKYVIERKKKPVLLDGGESSDSGSYVRTRKKGGPKHGYRTRATHNNLEETGVNRLTTRALYDTEVEEDEESGAETIIDSDADNLWNSDNSESDSSDYSDWTASAGLNLQPPKRTSQRQPKKKVLSSSADEGAEEEVTSKKKKGKKPPPRKKIVRQAQQKLMREQPEISELPEQFRPPDWLTDTIPRKAPYVPQIGDEVIYFRQGHELYVKAVKSTKAYDIDPRKNLPWHKNPQIREQELVRIIGLRYEICPPRLCCLKLAYIDPETGKQTGGSFTIKYHDMPDVIDFYVLRQNYDVAMSRNWKPGDRFRSMIDDAWWMGIILSQEPFQSQYPDSMFQCFNVKWDNGELEKMSPWDLEPIDDSRVPNTAGGSVEVLPDELKSLMYTPKEHEWPAEGRDVECERIARGLEQIMELSIAEPFLAPVDLNKYPIYGMIIEYPTDLSTIKARVENHFYRRIAAIQFDIRYIETNARTFNQPGSLIVRQSKLLTELCLKFIGDVDCTDPLVLYNQLAKDADFALHPGRSAAEDGEEEEDEVDVESDDDRPGPSRKNKRPARRNKSSNLGWKEQCAQLLDVIYDCDDSEPFRHPVDPLDYADYANIIDTPMDLTTVKEQMQCGNYDSPQEFAKDVRLVFNNSKQYNTNKKSRIYAMTLRLSAMFEDQMKEILAGRKKIYRSDQTSTRPSAEQRRRPPRPQLRADPVHSPKKNVARTSSVQRDSSRPSTSGAAFFNRAIDTAGSSTTQVATRTRAQTSGVTTVPPHRKRPRRLRIEDNDEDDEEEDEEEDDDDQDSDYAERPAKRAAPSASRRSTRKPISNGTEKRHEGSKRYGTRKSTGSLKPSKYKFSDSDKTDEEVDEAETEIDESNKNTDNGSASDSDSKSEKSGSNDSSSSSSSDSSSSSSESSSSEESVSSEPPRKKIMRQNPRKTAVPKTNGHSNKQRYTSNGQNSRSKQSREGDSRRYSTRYRGQRTVHYQEDSDFEYTDAADTEDFDENISDTAGVSRSGRLRKLTPKMKASLWT
ncbi:bromodomain and WD repeat-containing protein 3 [Lingula anatina]|uniref:Bromodomain and WD repeat-containing protein 3 n=1 Tax=Lingula anatina TaxID=7574 RepID=A0A1S3HIY2_LINAN|nr:bromodomain and WD repeat-containing protein 3 [Lingula anatina]|eukprot:XP_013385977.1 bromodomain and WD repeat-containing protein 3 [Lingula anatina]